MLRRRERRLWCVTSPACAALLAGALLSGAASVGAQAAPAPPLFVVRLELSPDPRAADKTRVEAVTVSPAGRVLERALRSLEGRCVVDVGGMDSLSVARCELPDGEVRDFEILEVGRRVVVDEYVTRTPSSARRRVRRLTIATRRDGWAVVPRCAETFQDPRACPPGSLGRR